MDFRWVVAVMVVMAILDMIGRMLRKQAGELPVAKGDSVKGADVLKYLTGEEPEPPGADSPARAARDRTGAPVPLRTEAAAGPVAEGRTAVAPVPFGGGRAPEVRDRGPRETEVWDRGPREIALRSRDPRGMEVRSREPRPLVSRPSSAHSAPGEPPSADSVTPPRGVPASDAPGRRDVPPLPPPTPLRRSVDLAGQLGLGGAGALRRAVLAREVLGRPLALREELREDE